MWFAVFIALLAASMVGAADARAKVVVQSNTASGPHLAGTSVVWTEGSTLLRRRAGGRVTRLRLPPGPTSITDASATHVVVQRGYQECLPNPDGTATCPLRLGMWAGPLDGPIVPVPVRSGCAGVGHGPAAAIDRGVAVLTEDQPCEPRGRRSAIVRVDLASGHRRTLARLENRPHAIRAAGGWVAWLQAAGYRRQIVLWRAGAVRRLVEARDLAASEIRGWDLQADGTLVLMVWRATERGEHLYAIRPGRAPRRFARIRAPVHQDLLAARDRVVTYGSRGRARVLDLAGRSRRLPRPAGVPYPLADFDGRRGLWRRTKVLVPGVFCPYDAPGPCTSTGSVMRHWLVADRIAR